MPHPCLCVALGAALSAPLTPNEWKWWCTLQGTCIHLWGLSGDNLFSAPKTSQSLSNSDLGYLRHSLGSDRLQIPETLQSTSYSKPLPAVPNATAHSFHSDPLPDTSDGCSETSTSSEGNPETSSDSAPSNLNSAPMFFGDSPSRSGDKVTPTTSNIKGQVIKVIHDIKG